jgi:hypothetical protein
MLGSAWTCYTGIGRAEAQAPAEARLSADDVSWLFPPPSIAADLPKGIAVKDIVSSQDGNPVWSATAFAQFVGIASGDPDKMTGGVTSQPMGIDLPASVRNVDAWQIAGVRIDAGAPGLSKSIVAEFGQSPQIRLILHPVTVNRDGTLTVHDIAAHLIFSFELQPPEQRDASKQDCLPKIRPDLTAFRPIVADAAALRDKLSVGGFGGQKILTAGAPLGVHPGLSNAATEASVRDAMKAFLISHLTSSHLSAMSVTGLGNDGQGQPWIFLSMLFDPLKGAFVPVPGPTLQKLQFAELLNPRNVQPRVVPMPVTNNIAPTTCESAAMGKPTVPVEGRIGMSTAGFFADTRATQAKAMLVADHVADASASHFFNTDCVSCHTETRIAMRALGSTSFNGIDGAALPGGDWDVRNFGWGPGKDGKPQATVTRRTASETAVVVSYINDNLLGK